MSAAPVTIVSRPSASRRHAAAGGLISARPPADGEPDALVGRQRAPPLPQRVLAQALQALERAEHVELLSGHRRVAGRQHVAQAQLERVHAQALGQLVHQRLERERGLRRAGGAVGAERDPVGRHPVPGQVVGLPAVGARGEQRGNRLDPEVARRAAVGQHTCPDPRQASLARGSDLDLEHLGAGRIGGGEVLGPGHHQAHRAAQLQGGRGGQRVGDQQLASEPAAERRRAYPDPVGREPEQSDDLVAGVERPLGRGGDDQVVLGVEPGRGGLRLQVPLIGPGGLEASADERVARSQRAGHVAVCQPHRAEHVVGKLFVGARRARGHRCVGVGHVRPLALLRGEAHAAPAGRPGGPRPRGPAPPRCARARPRSARGRRWRSPPCRLPRARSAGRRRRSPRARAAPGYVADRSPRSADLPR